MIIICYIHLFVRITSKHNIVYSMNLYIQIIPRNSVIHIILIK